MGRLVKVDKLDRQVFFGTFEKISYVYNYTKKRNEVFIKLINITDENGNYLCNYSIFNYIKCFSSLLLVPGDRVCFHARPVICQDVYTITDWAFYNPKAKAYCRLMYPTKAVKLINPVARINTNMAAYNSISNAISKYIVESR